MELEFLHALQELRSDLLDKIVLFLTSLGNGGFLWILISVLLMVVPAIGKESKEDKEKRRKTGICMFLSLAITAIIVNVILKNSVQRLRPFQVDSSIIPLITPGEYSFPSGHSASSFAAATCILLRHRKFGIFAMLFAGVIAFTRLYLFVHFPTDVLAGMLVGTLCAVGVCACIKKKEGGGN